MSRVKCTGYLFRLNDRTKQITLTPRSLFQANTLHTRKSTPATEYQTPTQRETEIP